MKLRFFRPLFPARLLYPGALFRVNTSENVIYLTFDDGPAINSTARILKVLTKYNIRALFFCTGRSAQENPDLLDQIRSSGHIIGHHGYLHLDGLRCTVKKYVRNAETSLLVTSATLFRPPYGRMRLLQYREIKRKFKIFLWDLMVYDFDREFGSARSLKVLKERIRPGSVVVFHDNSRSTVHDFLEEFILFCFENNYRFELPPLSGKR